MQGKKTPQMRNGNQKWTIERGQRYSDTGLLDTEYYIYIYISPYYAHTQKLKPDLEISSENLKTTKSDIAYLERTKQNFHCLSPPPKNEKFNGQF